MRPIFFRAYGFVTLFASLLVLKGLPENPTTFGYQLRTLIGVGVVIVIGTGLMYLRKWAAVYFSVPLFCYGAWFAIASIEPIPFPLNLAYMAWGASLMLPLFVTIRIWSQLTWGRSCLSRLEEAYRALRALLLSNHLPVPTENVNVQQFNTPAEGAWLIENVDSHRGVESAIPIEVVYRLGDRSLCETVPATTPA